MFDRSKTDPVIKLTLAEIEQVRIALVGGGPWPRKLMIRHNLAHLCPCCGSWLVPWDHRLECAGCRNVEEYPERRTALAISLLCGLAPVESYEI